MKQKIKNLGFGKIPVFFSWENSNTKNDFEIARAKKQ
tara:strand:+ start:98 stop:208 length:111 start_codon:yes stop_codon:yes gene_type:complete